MRTDLPGPIWALMLLVFVLGLAGGTLVSALLFLEWLTTCQSPGC